MIIVLHGRSGYVKGNEIVMLSNESLNIKLESDVNYPDLFAICTIGKNEQTIRIRDGAFTIPFDFLTEGVLTIDIQQIRNGQIIKRWDVEKITLRKTVSKFEAIPEIAEIKQDINIIKKALAEISTMLKNKNRM
jgi:hypothetical protein